MLIVNDLSFEYIKGNTILDHISFNVTDGEMIAILGIRGSGKSTIAKILSKEIKKYSGEVLLNGNDIRDVSIKDMRILYLTDDYLLEERKSVIDNISYGLKLRKYPKEKIDKISSEVISRLGLVDNTKEKVKNLAVRDKFKIAFGRGIARNPDLVILDEALIKFDFSERVSLLKEIECIIADKKLTTIFLTEDVELLKVLSKRTIVLNYGEISFDGEFTESKYSLNN